MTLTPQPLDGGWALIEDSTRRVVAWVPGPDEAARLRETLLSIADILAPLPPGFRILSEGTPLKLGDLMFPYMVAGIGVARGGGWMPIQVNRSSSWAYLYARRTA